jgi:hypothetical protein
LGCGGFIRPHGGAGQNNDIVSFFDQKPGKGFADKACSAGDKNRKHE